MSFLAPAFLFALPLLAVPLLVHLFNRRQQDIIRWGAMELLLGGATPRRRFLRLRDLLLMLLRAALVLAMIAALARPTLSLSWSGAAGPRDIIVVLDNSLSTARKVGGTTLFDRERAEAIKVIGQLNPSDELRVLLVSPTPRWLSDTPVSADGANQRSLVAQLQELKPGDGSMDMYRTLQEAVKAEAAGKDMARFITVITDGQAYGWRANAASIWTSLDTLIKKSAFPVVANIIIPDGAFAPAANLSVQKLAAARAVVGAGQPATFTASVENTGVGTSRATSLVWSAGQSSLGVSTIPPLDAGAGTTVSISEPFGSIGLQDVTCRLADADDLAPDDSAHFLLEVVRSVPVLIVEGEPQADPIQSDTRYLLTALGGVEGANAERPAGSVFSPKVISYRRLRDEDISAYPCIILANVPRLLPETVEKLQQHVNSGGGLWIALGGQADVDTFNRSLFDQGTGLSPVNHEVFAAVAPPSPDHPATALLADVQRLDVDRGRVYRRHQFDIGSGNSVLVLLRADGGTPLVVEKELGRGRVILQAFPLGLAWSNLPLCQAYVVMVHEWLWYLSEPGMVKRNLLPGEALQLAVAPDTSDGGATLEAPEEHKLQVTGIEQDNRILFRSARTALPGEYRLTLRGGKEGAREERFLVSRDPEESNLTPLSDAEMHALAKSAGLNFGAQPLAIPSDHRVAGPPQPVAQWVLLALAGLLAVEAFAAFWLARGRRSRAPAVPMQPAHARPGV
jgi:hypothetical protein